MSQSRWLPTRWRRPSWVGRSYFDNTGSSSAPPCATPPAQAFYPFPFFIPHISPVCVMFHRFIMISIDQRQQILTRKNRRSNPLDWRWIEKGLAEGVGTGGLEAFHILYSLLLFISISTPASFLEGGFFFFFFFLLMYYYLLYISASPYDATPQTRWHVITSQQQQQHILRACQSRPVDNSHLKTWRVSPLVHYIYGPRERESYVRHALTCKYSTIHFL